MEKADHIFKTLKYLYRQNHFSRNCKCEEVADKAGIDISQLSKYLTRFQELGLIVYSTNDKDRFLTFTSLGLKTESLIELV